MAARPRFWGNETGLERAASDCLHLLPLARDASWGAAKSSHEATGDLRPSDYTQSSRFVNSAYFSDFAVRSLLWFVQVLNQGLWTTASA
jgi:hypothetical protein